MGLMDRDYMHERHRQSRQFSRKNVKPLPAAHGGMRWLLRLFVFGVVAAIVIASSKALLLRDAQTFPPSGRAIWYMSNANAEARFTIIAPSDTRRMYAVRLDDDATGRPVVLIPLRSGETHVIKVPLGRFQVTMASGTVWYGPEKLFGIFGQNKKSVNALHFYRTGSEVMGNLLDLTERLDGNMATRAALPFEK